MNIKSSRGHSIVMMTVIQTDKVQQVSRLSQLFLVDLAGSEKVCKTHVDGMRLEEAKRINTSLLALQNVIAALNDAKVRQCHYCLGVHSSHELSH